VRLVPNFDTYMLGYEDRKLTVEEKYSRRILRGGGWVHPAVIRDGLAVATWRYDGKNDVVVMEPFGAPDSSLQPLLRNEVEDVGRFLGTQPSLEIRDRRWKEGS
jgi:winged helix DNA-binding protein